MTALTLRQIPPPVEKAIREKAKRDNISLSKAVVSLLSESSDDRRPTSSQRHHDLDWLCGIWTGKESDAFKKRLAASRPIDEELWK